MERNRLKASRLKDRYFKFFWIINLFPIVVLGTALYLYYLQHYTDTFGNLPEYNFSSVLLFSVIFALVCVGCLTVYKNFRDTAFTQRKLISDYKELNRYYETEKFKVDMEARLNAWLQDPKNTQKGSDCLDLLAANKNWLSEVCEYATPLYRTIDASLRSSVQQAQNNPLDIEIVTDITRTKNIFMALILEMQTLRGLKS